MNIDVSWRSSIASKDLKGQNRSSKGSLTSMMRRSLPILLITAGLYAGSAELDRARQLFNRSQYQAAVNVLSPLVNTPDGPTQELLGKSYFMMGEFKKAGDAF